MDEGESQVEFFLHIQIVYVHCPKGNARSQQWPKVGVIIHGLLTDDPFSLMVRFTDMLTFGFWNLLIDNVREGGHCYERF